MKHTIIVSIQRHKISRSMNINFSVLWIMSSVWLLMFAENLIWKTSASKIGWLQMNKWEDNWSMACILYQTDSFTRQTKHIRTYQPPNQISKQLCSMYNMYIVMTFSVRLIEVKPDQTEEKNCLRSFWAGSSQGHHQAK